MFIVQMICVKHFAWLRSGRKLDMEVVSFPSQWLNVANFSILLWFICSVIKRLQGKILETNIKMSLMSLMWFQDIFYPVMDLIAVWRWTPIRMESVGIKNKGDLYPEGEKNKSFQMPNSGSQFFSYPYVIIYKIK